MLHHEGALNVVDHNCTMDNFFKNNWWDIDKSRTVINEDIVHKIINVPIGAGSDLQDTQI